MMKTRVTQVIGICCWLVSTLAAAAAIGDKGSMSDACHSSETELRRLCSIVNEHFETEQDGYIYIGTSFYLVSVSNTARAAQGLYVANTITGQFEMFGGYGLPSLGETKILANGSLVIGTSQSSMSHGHYWKSDNVLQVRSNPVTKTPYLISQEISALVDASEELQSFCTNKQNKNHPDCTEKRGWGKPVRTSTNIRSTASLLKAHRAALAAHKNKKPGSKEPFVILESAGVRSILDKKPDDMTMQEYVNILNDYAFFSYQYRTGRNSLAIEILDKVIRLSPERIPAYLNMAQALEYLSKHADMPLSPDTIEKLKSAAVSYMTKYQDMKASH